MPARSNWSEQRLRKNPETVQQRTTISMVAFHHDLYHKRHEIRQICRMPRLPILAISLPQERPPHDTSGRKDKTQKTAEREVPPIYGVWHIDVQPLEAIQRRALPEAFCQCLCARKAQSLAPKLQVSWVSPDLSSAFKKKGYLPSSAASFFNLPSFAMRNNK